MPKTLCFRPRHNSPGKHDVTGAFAPEADKFLGLHGGKVHAFDNRRPMGARRREVLEILRATPFANYDAVAFFCHGWATGIQAGFTRAHVRELAEAVRGFGTDVALYCCSTGADPQDSPKEAAGTGENSFADKLRDALCALGDVDCSVVAHSTVAHTTKNPHVLFFDGMGSPVGGTGGYYPVAPGSALWRAWRKRLRETDLRLRMPFMSVADIHAELLDGTRVNG